MPKPTYCPQCAEPLVVAFHAERDRLLCPNRTGCGYVSWNNPLPVVAAIVEHEGLIILARNVAWPPTWYAIITGFLEKGEAPEEAVLREVKEELNLDGEVVSFVGVYPFFERNELILCYHVRAWGEIILNEELSDYKKLRPEEIRPWPMGTGHAVRDWLAAQGIENK